MKPLATDLSTLSLGEGADELILAGVTRRELRLSRALQDRTHTDSQGWRERSSLGEPADLEIRAQGTFLTGAASSAVRAQFLSGDDAVWSLTLPDAGVWTGRFHLQDLVFTGRSEQEETFSLRLLSTGPITFTSQN